MSFVEESVASPMVMGFLFFLGLFVLIGLMSVVKSRGTTEDYLLAGRNVKPWLAGLSAIATNNSGFMFTGMIGFTYIYGVSAIWLLLGFLFGDLFASLVVHKRLRAVCEQEEILTFSGALSRFYGEDYRFLRMLIGLITVVFLGSYAAAQFMAGSKALYVLFGWPYHVGAIIGAGIVLLYCFSGGIRASLWTDVAQSFIMLFSMLLLFLATVEFIGGKEAFFDGLLVASDSYLDLFPPASDFGVPVVGPFLFVMGWFFTGMGAVGQPHIMIRFLAVNKTENIMRLRFYYYGWYALFSLLVFGCGLVARIALYVGEGQFDPELALPLLSFQVLPGVLVGLILAGLFAATMSTADSQILSCSAALTRDFKKNHQASYWFTKLVTAIVVTFALFIALHGPRSVFQLVIYSWSILGSCFAPLIFVLTLGGRPSERTAIAMVLTGLGAIILWSVFNGDAITRGIVLGIIAGFVPFLLSKDNVSKHSQEKLSKVKGV